MDNCTCISREIVSIVYGNDFTIEAHVSVYDKDEGIYKLLDLTGVKECQMRLVGTYRKVIGKNVAVSGSKVTAFFPGGSIGVGTYGVEITFVDSLGKGRIFERNLIGIVSASGDATVDNDIEGEAGEGLNVSVNVLTRIVRIGGGGTSGSGATDYPSLTGKPSINGVVLEGDKRPSDLGMYSKVEADEKFETKESAAEADKRVQGMLDGKVDKVEGKGLSSNDFTDAEKAKLAGLKNYDDTQVRELIAGKADLQHQHTVADITDFPELYYDATAFLTSEAYPSDKYEELLEAVKAKKTVYATIDEEGYTSYIFFMSSANSDGSSSRVLLTTIFADGGYLYMNTFVLQQSGMTPLRENISGKVDKEPGKGLSTNDLTDERAGKVDMLAKDGRANEYLNGAGTYSRPVRQGYGVSVADDNTVSVDPQVIARQSDVASVAADLAQYAKTAEVTEMINRAVVSAINTEI